MEFKERIQILFAPLEFPTARYYSSIIMQIKHQPFSWTDSSQHSPFAVRVAPPNNFVGRGIVVVDDITAPSLTFDPPLLTSVSLRDPSCYQNYGNVGDLKCSTSSTSKRRPGSSIPRGSPFRHAKWGVDGHCSPKYNEIIPIYD